MIALVQSKSAVTTSATTSRDVTWDATPTSGNLMVACVAMPHADDPSLVPPSGWTVEMSWANGGIYCALCYKVAGGSETTTPSWSWTGACEAVVEVAEFSGLTATPLDSPTKRSVGATSNNPAPDSAAAGARANDLFIVAVGVLDQDDATGQTSGWNFLGNTHTTSGTADVTGILTYKIATAKVFPTTDSITLGSSKAWVAHITGFLGVGPANTVAPAVTGTTTVGSALSTTDGTWSGEGSISYAYQWQRADNSGFSSGVTNIGTNSSSYTLTSNEYGKYVRCVVTATDAVIGANTANSNVVGAVFAVAEKTGKGVSDLDARGAEMSTWSRTGSAVSAFAASGTKAGVLGFYFIAEAAPFLSVEIDFTNDPTGSTRNWETVTGDVRSLQITRSGRNNELQRTEAGTMQAVLDNRLGKYDPANVNGPHYPNVKRMRWMRVRASYGGTIYERWRGLIETWIVRWPGSGQDSLVEIRGTDVFKVLNLFSLDGQSYASEAEYVRVQNVLDDVGGIEYTVDTNADDTIVASGTLTESDMALAHLLNVEETENGTLFAEGDGKVVFQSRQWRTLNSDESVATIGDDPTQDEIPYRDASYEYPDDDVWNSWAVTPSGGTAEIATDTASTAAYFTRPRTRSLLVTSQAIAANAAQALVLRYANPDPRVTALELLGTAAPTTWPDILSLVNSNRVQWIRRADYGTINEEFFVERVSDRIRPGDWTVSVELSPSTSNDVWLLGNATYGLLGQTTALSY